MDKIARYLLAFMILVSITQSISAQNISLGATYTNSDAYFLKSLPGMTVGYDQQIWRMYFFLYGYATKRDYTYAEYSSPYISMQSGYGEVFKGNVNTGVAIYVLRSEHYSISIGTYLGLNYVHRKEITTHLQADEYGWSRMHRDTMDYWYKNRWGYGVFLDMEIKQFMFEQMGLFTRIEMGYTRLMDGSMIRGVPFLVYGYNSISFSIGLKYNLRKKN